MEFPRICKIILCFLIITLLPYLWPVLHFMHFCVLCFFCFPFFPSVAQKVLALKEHEVALGDCRVVVQAEQVRFLVPARVEVLQLLLLTCMSSWPFVFCFILYYMMVVLIRLQLLVFCWLLNPARTDLNSAVTDLNTTNTGLSWVLTDLNLTNRELNEWI